MVSTLKARLIDAARDFAERNDTPAPLLGVVSAQEQCRRIAICRACEHFTYPDVTRDGMPTCARCENCKTRIVHFSLQSARCPEGEWRHAVPALETAQWPDLWKIHDGATALVVGRGPSRDTPDLGGVGRDITLATNLSLWEPEKQTATHVDYDVSVDEGPCRLLRPKGVRLISAANTDAGKKHRDGLCWAIAPNYGEGVGPVRRGYPIPTAVNSGVAAVALALIRWVAGTGKWWGI